MSSTVQFITISTAAQLATVSRYTERVARARAYATRLGAHAAEIRAQLDAAAESDAAGPLRGELIEVDRQHRQAVEILTGVEAEHVRHEADLRTLHGSDGQARAKLADTHAARAAAATASDAAAAVLDRSKAHAEAVERRLADGDVLAIWPANKPRQGAAVTVSPETGLVGYPAFASYGLILTTLFQGTLKYGCKITVQSQLKPACGDWFAVRVEYQLDCMTPNGRWFAVIETARIGPG